jgi:ribosomal protein S27E
MTEHLCVIDQRRQYDRAQVCSGCRLWLDRTLAEILELYALLPDHLAPGRAQEGQRVSGSREAPLPLRVDPLDLTMAARVATVHDVGRDQIGLLSVASVLDSWARDWAEVRDMRETLPAPTVVELATWLGNRHGWACDLHPAVDDYAHELRDVRRSLRAVVGVNEVRPEYLDVPCRRCDLMDLHRLPGQDRVECGSCGDLLTEDEYRRWVKLLAADIRESA